MLEELTRRLRELGFSLSLQRFGGRFSMIGNLARLGLAYLKSRWQLHSRRLISESDKRLFIEAIQRAAHSIDLPLIAERVETEGELSAIREMGRYGVQGQVVRCAQALVQERACSRWRVPMSRSKPDRPAVPSGHFVGAPARSMLAPTPTVRRSDQPRLIIIDQLTQSAQRFTAWSGPSAWPVPPAAGR